jgi:hypothetical protein
MANEIAQEEMVNELFKATPSLLKLPVTKMWIDYDKKHLRGERIQKI